METEQLRQLMDSVNHDKLSVMVTGDHEVAYRVIGVDFFGGVMYLVVDADKELKMPVEVPAVKSESVSNVVPLFTST